MTRAQPTKKKKRNGKPEKKVYGVRLDSATMDRIDVLSERRGGIGRPAIIKMAVVEYLNREEE